MKKNLFLVMAVAMTVVLAMAACSGKGTSSEKQLTDKEVLVKIFENLNGKNWKPKSAAGWCSEAPLGDWTGVVVNDSGRVIRLFLDADSLSGALPPEIKYLTELKQINFTLKNKGKNVENAIPAELWQMPNLERISAYESVGENDPKSTLPAEINLPKIKSIYTDLRNVDMTPLCALTTLEELILRYSDGKVPEAIGNLTKLTKLTINCSGTIETAIPASLGKLTNLTSLEIMYKEDAKAGIAFPAFVWDLKNLSSLSLYRVASEPSQIPADKVAQMSSLKLITVEKSALTGEIPGTLFTASSELLTVSLNNNDLTGSIPATVGKCTKLRSLYLRDNKQLGGSVPAELGNCADLSSLLLSGTGISSDVPASVKNLKKWDRISKLAFL